MPWAAVDPTAEGWDGIVLGRVVQCADCGAVDDYTLDERSRLTVLGRAMAAETTDRKPATSAQPSGVAVGLLRLWDGTRVRRPSEALAHLKREAEERPTGAAWRRLGNLCERYGRIEEAVASWSKALETDPDEADAAYSLAAHAFEECDVEHGFAKLCDAIARLPRAKDMKREARQQVGAALADMLGTVLASTDEPLALKAIWRDGEVRNGEPLVRLSGVDLREVRDWDALARFFASESVVGLALSSELPPQGEPSQLADLLEGGAPGTPADLVPLVRARPKVGRNDPCICGSGRKFKKCCGMG